jgi:hypothetical protein
MFPLAISPASKKELPMLFGYRFKTEEEAAVVAKSWQEICKLPISELKSVSIHDLDDAHKNGRYVALYNADTNDTVGVSAFEILFLRPHASKNVSFFSMHPDNHHTCCLIGDQEGVDKDLTGVWDFESSASAVANQIQQLVSALLNPQPKKKK